MIFIVNYKNFKIYKMLIINFLKLDKKGEENLIRLKKLFF